MLKNEVKKEVVEMFRKKIKEGEVLNSFLEIIADIYIKVERLERKIASIDISEILLPLVSSRYAGKTTFKIVASMPLSSDWGFYYLEYDKNGQPFRWTGPDQHFYFDLHLDRSIPLKFELTVFLKDESQVNIKAFTDNIEIPLKRKVNENCVVYTGILPPRNILGLTRITFVVPKMYKPEPPDTRVLGVIFKELSVTPAQEDDIDEFSNYVEEGN